jgi:cell shape-determining protein MreD
VPNLVFILFFTLAFFENKNKNYLIVFYAVLAGILLDVFSYTYLGPAIILLIIIGFLLKKAQALLKNRQNTFPFAYFLPLFIIFLSAYDFILDVYLKFLDPGRISTFSATGIIFSIIYNSAIASMLFFIYKWQKHTK